MEPGGEVPVSVTVERSADEPCRVSAELDEHSTLLVEARREEVEVVIARATDGAQ